MENLTKKEKRELRRNEWHEKQQAIERQEKIKKYSIWGGIALFFVGLLILLIKLASSSQSISPNSGVSVPPVKDSDIVIGSESAPVTLFEYADFQCPACASYHPVVRQLLSEYNGKLKLVARMFPLTNIHPKALISGQAAYAAYKQGKFAEMADLLYSNQDTWVNANNHEEIFIDYAKQLELDLDKFEADMKSNEAEQFVKTQEAEAKNLGLKSTPTFGLNGKIIPNPKGYEDFKKLIDEALKGKIN